MRASGVVAATTRVPGERRRRLAVALGRAARDVDVEQMNLVVVRGDSAVGPDEQRARRRALAAVVANRDRAADDPDAELLGRLGEKSLRRAVAEALDRRDAIGVGRAEERKVLGQHDELRALLRGLGDEPAGFAKVGLHVARARHLHCRYFHRAATSAGFGGMPFGGSSAHSAPSSSCSSVSRSTVGSLQLPVTQYEARPMPPNGFLKMRVKISSAAATCGPAEQRADRRQHLAGLRRHDGLLPVVAVAQPRAADEADLGHGPRELQVVGVGVAVDDDEVGRDVVEHEAAIEHVAEIEREPPRQRADAEQSRGAPGAAGLDVDEAALLARSARSPPM